MDFNKIYAPIYRCIFNLHKQFHERPYNDPAKFWLELAGTAGNHSSGVFESEIYAIVVGELERVKEKGNPPNADYALVDSYTNV